MKKGVWLIITAALLLAACNNNDNAGKPGDDPKAGAGKINPGNGDSCKIACADTLIIAAWKKIFNIDRQKEFVTRDIELEVKDTILVKGCIKAYEDAVNNGTMKAAAYTESITYGSAGLEKWLITTLSGFNDNNIKVYIGMYTAEFIQAYPKASGREGRLTVFLWPHHDDERATRKNGGVVEFAKVFNLGDLKP